MSKKLIIIPSVFVVICLLTASTAYFYYQYQQALSKDPAKELSTILSEVDKIMVLPTSEPTLATITEKEKLSSQSFFKNAENGDKLLLYVTEGKAILYRPSIRKIIDIAPISPDTQQNDPTTTNLPATDQNTATLAPESINESDISTTTLELYNGTPTAGLTSNIESKIVQALSSIEVTDKNTAARTDYESTLVIDVSGNNASLATELSQLLNATVSELPEGEQTPKSDLLIIVGMDYSPEDNNQE